VLRSLTVAIRINETRTVGAIQGQRTVTVRGAGGTTNAMQFTLYAVPSG
jgi:type VI secretion system protein ImpJ